MNRISRTGKVAHDLGLSTRFGGTLFGRVSLNPAVSNVSDERERGRVLNEAWARFQAANLPAILSTLLGWRPTAAAGSRIRSTSARDSDRHLYFLAEGVVKLYKSYGDTRKLS